MKLGLIGKSLEHSFSPRYFAGKFRRAQLSGYSYQRFELPQIDDFPALIDEEDPDGLNVTIPYKTQVIPYLDELTDSARSIGAVNTIAFSQGRSTGHNTDWIGFRDSLTPLLKPHHKQALILGSGGASKAVRYALENLGIATLTVSRNPKAGEVDYREASERLQQFPLVINTTPLGTFPKTEEMPPLSLANVSEIHLFYDLVYNPAETRLLSKVRAKGAQIKNGYQMLELQAEAAWQFWLKTTS